MTYIKYFPTSIRKFTKSKIPKGQSRYKELNSVLLSTPLHTGDRNVSAYTTSTHGSLYIISQGMGASFILGK